MRTGFIYLIRNTVNGKTYIGQTVQAVKTRWLGHKSEASLGKGHALHRAIRKYGVQCFTIETLTESLEPFLGDLERMFIRLHGSLIEEHGYNLTDGGELQKKLSPETRAKLRAANLGKKHSPETIAKMRLRRGEKRSPETCVRMSDAQRGRKFSAAHKAKIAETLRGKHHSPETRARMAESQRLRYARQKVKPNDSRNL